jgi:hypothetical protein
VVTKNRAIEEQGATIYTLNSVIRTAVQRTVRIRYTADNWLYRQPSHTRQKLVDMRKKAAGAPTIVVGNGPSLRETPLDEFKDVFSIGMNKISLLFPLTTWRPSLIVCVNNLVVRQSREFLATTQIPTFLAWKCRWFAGRPRNCNVHYFKSVPTSTFSTDASSWVGGLAPTVTYSALQFAYFLGGDPVILFGIDHQFRSDENRSGIEKRSGPDTDHFDPEYFRPGQYWGLPDLQGSEKAYRIAKSAFQSAGRRVLDATVDGKLRVFDKISLDDARVILQKP